MRLSQLILTVAFLGAGSAQAFHPMSQYAALPGAAMIAATGQAGGDHRPHAGMLRFPDISAEHISFVYANDIWVVSREGGVALPLAGPPGQELFPRFSPDGKTIAFVGNYDGNTDLYTIPLEGGVPTRVTHHPSSEILCDWMPDNRLLFYTSAFAGLSRQTQLYAVPAAGGLPEKLPVPYGANGAVSPDGQWLAYTPHTRDQRTWKRYRGGMATDIWLFNLQNHTSKKITDWEGTDSQPMWHGKTVYYISDESPDHRLNIWAYDTTNNRRRQVTKLGEFDVKWPSIGPGTDGGGEIVFQHGPSLKVVDLKTERVRTVEVIIPGDRPRFRPQSVPVHENIQSYSISSTGKRGVIEARGDIWTVPAKHGSPRNLTRTAGVAERDPSWSPDGQWIAYFGDATGEYELYITQSDGRGETRQLTSNGEVYRYNPTWSPDSKHIAFSDKTGAMFLHTVEGATTRQFDVEPWASRTRMEWAPDSRWITYTKSGDNRLGAVWIYNVEKDEKHRVTSGRFSDSWPTFDRKGEFLYFVSARSFESPIYEDVGTTFAYAGTALLLAVPLKAEHGSPWAPKMDDELWGDDKKKDEKKDEEEKDKDKKDEKDAAEKKDDAEDKSADKPEDEEKEEEEEGEGEGEEKKKDKKDKAPKPVEIELEGFEARALQVPVSRGSFSQLVVNHDGKLLYVRSTPRGMEGKPAIKIFDPKDEKKEEKTVLEGFRQFSLSADGKKILVYGENRMAIVDAAPDQKMDKPMTLTGMITMIEPRKEWRQLFLETWRIQRDFFYDPTMHGVDWKAIRNQYARMLEDCASREDVTYVIGEMISEINVGHAYAREGGDTEKAPSLSVGLLGVDFTLDQGAYRIQRIHRGGPWDIDARGPLDRPGVDVKEGDWLLAVNGVPIDVTRDPWASFQGMAGWTVTITVSDQPRIDDTARHETVELIRNEGEVRYRAWIEDNRKYVEEKSGGRIGYIYVPNTGVNGQNDLFRQFYGQVHKEALIIDERWNGGGQIPTRFIELLNRPPANYWARRDGNDWPWPPDAHFGPKCMLINGLAGSGGDYFPWYFRQQNLGKLIGMRTWGGLVGISGNPILIDGGRVTAPTFAFYKMDGNWGVEGHGVDPDIEVIDDPALMVDGGDPQLDAGIAHLLQELERNPYRAPQRPAYPDRTGMGIPEHDR